MCAQPHAVCEHAHPPRLIHHQPRLPPTPPQTPKTQADKQRKLSQTLRAERAEEFDRTRVVRRYRGTMISIDTNTNSQVRVWVRVRVGIRVRLRFDFEERQERTVMLCPPRRTLPSPPQPPSPTGRLTSSCTNVPGPPPIHVGAGRPGSCHEPPRKDQPAVARVAIGHDGQVTGALRGGYVRTVGPRLTVLSKSDRGTRMCWRTAWPAPTWVLACQGGVGCSLEAPPPPLFTIASYLFGKSN